MIGQKDLDFFLNHLNSFSKKKGVAFDFFAWERRDNNISFEKQKLQNYSTSKDKNLALRLSKGDKSGFSYTKNFSKESIEECHNQAFNSLKLSDQEERGEFSVNQKYVDMSKTIYNSEMSSMDLSEKMEKVKSMDQASLSLGDKIQPVYNIGADQEFSCVFGNSEQTQGSYSKNSVTAYSYCLAIDKNHRSQGISQQSSRNYNSINFQKLGQESASKCLKKLNFSIPKTDCYPVIFQSGQAAGMLVSLLLGHLNGKNIYEKLSLLQESLNKKKLSSLLNLYDDPFASWGLNSVPFDGEGFSSQKTILVEDGVIKNYLTNSFTAKTLKTSHTAKASRLADGRVGVNFTNIVMKEGTDSFHDLVKEYPQVIVIDFLKGLAGYNSVSGNFSIESEGFLWNGGEETPICQFTVSGNIIDVFANILKITKDSVIYYNGSFKIPSFLVPELSIAGG